MTSEERSTRRIDCGFFFEGPLGFRNEVFLDMERPLAAPCLQGPSGYVAGDLGLGHLAFLVPDLAAARREFEACFCARHRDDIVAETQGQHMELTFLSLNARHHSIALAAFAGPLTTQTQPRLAHLAVEMASVADVEMAYDRAVQQGWAIGRQIGQHPNDLATSFYIETPSGFEIEIAGGCVVVEDGDAWVPKKYDVFSLWGHQRLNLVN